MIAMFSTLRINERGKHIEIIYSYSEMGTKISTPKIHETFCPNLSALQTSLQIVSVARKRTFNSTSSDQVFLHTKVCPHHITQVVLKVVRASEG